jgi:hypothetical protein
MKSGQEEHRKTHEGADVVEFVVVGFRGYMAYFCYVFWGVCFLFFFVFVFVFLFLTFG